MRRERGNILFLILLAVVLFAALSYAVTRSFQGGTGDNMSKEEANAAASDMLNWLGQIDTAVQRLRVIKGIPIEQIDFNDPNNLMQTGSVQAYDNSSCTTTDCEIFSPAGGAVPPRDFEQYADQSASTGSGSLRKPGHHTPMVVNVDGLGTPLNDVAIRIDYIKLPICRAINRLQGLPECPSVGGGGTYFSFAGSAATIASNLAEAAPYTFTNSAKGQVTFCSMSCSTPTTGSLYRVLIER